MARPLCPPPRSVRPAASPTSTSAANIKPLVDRSGIAVDVGLKLFVVVDQISGVVTV